MAEINGNGVYIIASDGTKIPLRRAVLAAIQRMVENRETGAVTIHFKSGGVSAVEGRTMYQE